MKAILIKNLVRPLTERLGTALAVWLVAEGWNGDLVQQFVTGLVATLLVAVDLFLSRVHQHEAD